MDFRSYIQQSISLKGLNKNQFGSLTMGNINTEQLKNVSLFSSASLEQIQNLDWSKLLSDLNSTEIPEEALGTPEEQALADIVKELMSMEDVQTAADIDGDGKVSEAEAQKFVESMMSADGDESTFTYDDIDKALQNLGINIGEAANQAILDALQENDAEDVAAALEKMDETAPSAPTSAASSPAVSGGGNSGGGNYGNYGNNSAQQAHQKTAAEELEELEQQKKDIIAEADKNIESKENEKDELVEKSDKVDKELKDEYKTAKENLKQTTDAISKKESSIDSHKSELSGLEQDIAALNAEKGTLKTDTDDKEINSQNKSRLGEIEKSVSEKEAKKTKVEEEIAKEEKELEELHKKEEEQEKALADVEAKIAEADPELKTKMEKINGDIKELKTQKTNDVADIDAKIEAKRKEAKDEAKQAGENKGKAANNIGSGLVELASKYMGMNEADGSYKMFTNGRTEAWCADFVTYVVKEYAKQQGLSVKNGFGSPSVANLMSWAQNNGVFNNITGMSSSEKQKFLQSDLKPGDVIIWKSNGASHTGIIKSINNDGTFETVEGNSSDQVKSNHKSINDPRLTGFIKFSDIVS